MKNENMNKYRVTTNCETYGTSYMDVEANTPYDASEKAKKYMGWRQKEDITNQVVMILDGTQKEWTFENN